MLKSLGLISAIAVYAVGMAFAAPMPFQVGDPADQGCLEADCYAVVTTKKGKATVLPCIARSTCDKAEGEQCKERKEDLGGPVLIHFCRCARKGKAGKEDAKHTDVCHLDWFFGGKPKHEPSFTCVENAKKCLIPTDVCRLSPTRGGIATCCKCVPKNGS